MKKTIEHVNANAIAKFLLQLESRMDNLLRAIDSPQFRQISGSTEWQSNDALRDLDSLLNSAVDDFLLCDEINEALLSLEGQATSQNYRAWLSRYREAEAG